MWSFPEYPMHAVDIFEIILYLLALALMLHWIALKLRMPPAMILLLGGGAIAFVPGLPSITLNPELALILFLPPLLVDGAFYTPLGRFRRQLPGILSLAIGAVIFTTLIVGVVAHWLMPSLPWAACFALGAIVSPPDAVSARAVLKGVTLPRRLTTLLEGESLLNDATGLILFRFAIATTLSGTFHALDAFQSFFFVAIGGAVVGAAIGAVWVLLVPRLHDRLLTVGASVMLCWIAYLAGETLEVSGVLATVVAGLVQGWYQHTIVPAYARLQGAGVSEIMGFVLEALVFILIGFSLRDIFERIDTSKILYTESLLTIFGVVIAVTLARFVWIYGSDIILTLSQKLGMKRARPMGWRQATILSWAGMRGVVTLAIPLTLPVDMPGRDLILVCAVAVILVTVVLQGSSLGWLIRQINPLDTEPPARMDLPATETAMERVRHATVMELVYGENQELLHPQLLAESIKRLEFMENYALDSVKVMDDLRPHFDIVMQANAAARKELIRIHRAGMIEDAVLHELERDLDVEEMRILLQVGSE